MGKRFGKGAPRGAGRIWMLVLAAVFAAALHAPAAAQYSEIATSFKRLSPAQEKALREEVAGPVPRGALFETLRRHFAAKNLAAARLGDVTAREAVLREAVQHLPDAGWKMDLGALLLARGELGEGNHWRQLALRDAAGAQVRTMYAGMVARDLAEQFDAGGAAQLLARLRAEVESLQPVSRNTVELLQLRRAMVHAMLAESLLAQQTSRYEGAVQMAREAEEHARTAMGLLPSLGDPLRPVVSTELAMALSRRMDAQRAGRRFEDAERTFNEYVRLSSQDELSPHQMADLYLRAAELRFDRRKFVDALDLARRSDAVLKELGLDELHPARIDRTRVMLMAWIGSGLRREPAAALDRVDELAGSDEARQRRALMAFERGLVYLDSDREVEAAELFGGAAAILERRLGVGHFHAALMNGLRGVALWRADSRASRDEALLVLRGAVQQMMAPAQAEYVDAVGLRLELRNRVVETYLEAVAEHDRDEAFAAIPVADWIQTGVVREAMQDTALRLTATTPAVAQWIRQDQELRNEVRALRRYLDGTGGSIDTLMPALATRTRNRIGELEKERAALQARIRGRFPQYQETTRPSPADVARIAQRLAPDEALVMVLPTERAIYSWAVTSRGDGLFHRQPLVRVELEHLVKRLRRTLDFNEMRQDGARIKSFDVLAARELYKQVMSPLEEVLKGKRHLIVASSGALAEIPFAVLIGPSADYRVTGWLIRSFALSMQPSATAWLALRSVERGPASQAREPLMGWGDPVFKRVTAAGATAAAAAAPTGAGATRGVGTAAVVDGDSAEGSPLPTTRSLFIRQSAVSAAALADTRHADRYGEMLAPLPDTRPELHAIAGALGAQPERDLVFGEAATRASVLAASESGLLARKRVVAFATHGLMANDLPHLTQPALALAATGEENRNPLAPLLTLDDVMSLRLNADWVILSACNTASSDGTAGEALSGLARGFFYAGARSLLVTYWAVDSRSATLLTTATFSHHVANPGTRRAESLRQGMLSVMASTRYLHPAFWAPYGLIGDGGL